MNLLIGESKGTGGGGGAQGDTGVSGAPQGDTGVDGAQGGTGDDGSAGSQGDTGVVGGAGADGDTGVAGGAGAQGDTGSDGGAGAQGDTGDAGGAGADGDTGVAGGAGAQGDTGVTGGAGSQGDTGSDGGAGAQGDTGVGAGFGGDSQPYNFDTATAEADPGNGDLRYNNATPASVTKIFADDENSDAVDIQAWLRTLDDSTSTTPARLRVFKEDDTSIFHVFDVVSLTEETGYFDIDVSYVAGNGTFSGSDPIIMSLAVVGDKGDTGSDSTVQGDTGVTGGAGVQGDTGDAGGAGAQGDTGDAGGAGDTGAGEFGGYSAPFNFDTATAMSNPGSGDLRYDNTTMASVTAIAVSDTDGDSNDVDAFLDQFANSGQFGLIRIFSEATGGTEWTYFEVTGVTDNGPWHQLDVTFIASAGGDPPHASAEAVVLTFSPTGDQGDTGADSTVPGDQGDTGQGAGFGGDSQPYNFDTATGDADPGNGDLRFNNATPASVTEIYVDDENSDTVNVETWLLTIDDQTSVVPARLRIFKEDDTSIFHVFDVTSLADLTGYVRIVVTYVDGNGTFSGSDPIIISLAIVGDKGDTGTDSTVQGDTGVTGGAGAQGDTGDAGAGGAQGDTGDAGAGGAQGDTGSDGGAGAQGDTGDTGTQGIFGGYSARFNFDTATAMVDPGSGDLRLDNATIASVTQMVVSDTDADSNDVDTFLDELSNNGQFGLIRIFSEIDGATEFAFFEITAVVDSGAFHTIDLTYIGHTGGNPPFASTESIVLTFSPTGETYDWRGAWATATAYVLNDTVENDGSGYVCILAHTSQASDEPGVGGSWETFWDLLVEKGDTGVAGGAGAQGDTGVAGGAGAQGDTGDDGDTGAQGIFGGDSQPYNFDDATADADPGSGDLRFNNAAPASTTKLFIDDENSDAVDIQVWLRTIDDQASSIPARLRIFKTDDQTIFNVFDVTGLTESAGYFDVDVTFIVGNGSLSNTDPIVLSLSIIGDQGDTGADSTVQGDTGDAGGAGAKGDTGDVGDTGFGIFGGDSQRYLFDTATADVDPGSGNLRFNNATPASVTELYIDDLNDDAVNVEAWLLTIDDSTNTPPARLRIFKEDDSSVFHVFDVTSLADLTGYVRFVVTYVDGNGTFGNTDPIVMTLAIIGDQGTAGGAGAQGDTGDAGAGGAQGDTGESLVGGLRVLYNFEDDDQSAPPTADHIEANNATLSSVTQFFASETDRDSNSVIDILDEITPGDNLALINGDGSTYHTYLVNLSSDSGVYRTIFVAHIGGFGTLVDEDEVTLSIIQQGPVGDPGYGWVYDFDTSTPSPPTLGTIRFNNATWSSVTEIFVHDQIPGGNSIEDQLDDIGIGDKLKVTSRVDDDFVTYLVTGVTDSGAYHTFDVTFIGEANLGDFSDGEDIILTPSFQGDQGDTGVAGGAGAKGDTGDDGDTGVDGIFGGDSQPYLFDTTTADADPGSGNLRFNNATPASVTELYIDDLNDDAVNVETWLLTIDDATSVIPARLRIFKKDDSSVFHVYNVTSLADLAGYVRFVVTYVDGNGTFSNTDPIVVTLAIIGDQGDTGSDSTVQGDTGVTGGAGVQGDTGDAGGAGAKGDTGDDGKTLYSITVENPSASENIAMGFTFVAITVVEIQAVLVGSATPSVTIDPFHNTDRSGAGGATDILTSATAITSVTTGQNLTSFNDATIPADSWIILLTSAQSGTVTELTVTITYTID